MDEKERARALEQTLGQIEKQFGKGSILRLGAKDAIVPVSVISTGPSRSMRLWEPADFRADASAKSTARNPPVRRPSPSR